MKVAVSSTGPGLADPLDPRLGRCEYLLIVDADTMEFEAIRNENKTRGGGAGIQTARDIAERGATVVLTGNCGPNAHETLTAAGVQVITGMAGSVQDALDFWKRGGVAASDGPNVQSHAGMGGSGPSADTAGTGMGQGMGPGSGMGQGMGGGGRGWVAVVEWAWEVEEEEEWVAGEEWAEEGEEAWGCRQWAGRTRRPPQGTRPLRVEQARSRLSGRMCSRSRSSWRASCNVWADWRRLDRLLGWQGREKGEATDRKEVIRYATR